MKQDKEVRITPACAGNRSLGHGHDTGRPDHPRVCGEQYLLTLFLAFLLGSPPRVRGTVRVVLAK